MKTLEKFFAFFTTLIKKNFFISKSVANYYEPTQISDLKMQTSRGDETSGAEDYTSVYKSTTRWQTL
jgi:hypothetical protein